MNKTAIHFILISITIIIISQTLFMQKQLLEVTQEIKSSLVLECPNNISEILEKYINASKDFNTIWWNVIINQSGLSIIFAAIVVLISITLGILTKENIEKELNTQVAQNKEELLILIQDLSKLLSVYFVNSDDYSVSKDHINAENYLARINSFESLNSIPKSNIKQLMDYSIKSTSDLIIDALTISTDSDHTNSNFNHIVEFILRIKPGMQLEFINYLISYFNENSHLKSRYPSFFQKLETLKAFHSA